MWFCLCAYVCVYVTQDLEAAKKEMSELMDELHVSDTRRFYISLTSSISYHALKHLPVQFHSAPLFFGSSLQKQFYTVFSIHWRLYMSHTGTWCWSSESESESESDSDQISLLYLTKSSRNQVFMWAWLARHCEQGSESMGRVRVRAHLWLYYYYYYFCQLWYMNKVCKQLSATNKHYNWMMAKWRIEDWIVFATSVSTNISEMVALKAQSSALSPLFCMPRAMYDFSEDFVVHQINRGFN